MKNTPFKLILMRMFLVTFGRFNFFSKIFKKTLVKMLISKSKKKYMASANFFDYEELE